MDDEVSRATPTRGRRARNKLKKSQEIDRVVVEQAFQLRESSSPSENEAGSGCYVSTTINNKRFYGVLIEQGALQAATSLFFQDEASGLELNRRMEAMLSNMGTRKQKSANGDARRAKRQKLDSGVTLSANERDRQVQKFRYVPPGNGSGDGYRELLATFADIEAAGIDDSDLTGAIQAACRAGGRFVGRYYYQFESKRNNLSAQDMTAKRTEMRMSMGVETFLQHTDLPPWYPLSNLEVSQQRVLEMLNLKKDGKSAVKIDEAAAGYLPGESLDNVVLPDTVPMAPRDFGYKVVVMGGGIAGLSSCLELLRESAREGLDVEVTLVEARGRLGGRLWTDRETFLEENGASFPVDLGASWIHGIDQNPLAALAREAGVDFVTTSEEVKMFQAGSKEVNKDLDDRAGILFDKLLDHAADESWKNVDTVSNKRREVQEYVRWYSSKLSSRHHGSSSPRLLPNPHHRHSLDVSVDQAIGRAIAKFKGREFSDLSEIERRMLRWNLKNVEYALGANIADLSMKFWDIDERHAFEGDHVILKQGYSAVVSHLLAELQNYGDKFSLKLNFPVGKVEYARVSTFQPYFAPSSRRSKLTPLSDSCCVTSQDGKQALSCDFVVCTVPLGVLKSSLQEVQANGLEFIPELPFPKRDAIESVGFGLLDKLYLQFESAFWRDSSADETLFGNATGIHPHHYMFFDSGKGLSGKSDAPAILMSLISGREAVKCERLSDREVAEEAMETLRLMFSDREVPPPIKVKMTRWGGDRFSRGSYTFLPPGATDQDFKTLQSAVNGNGDSMLLQDHAETMRLFFAGEHTTALHPSMAHGALLSGIRAAKEVVASMFGTFFGDSAFDRTIPVPLFRHLNPKVPLTCALCSKEGTRIREGTLLAFKKGPNEILVHNNCAQSSPEVEVADGKWKDVFSACNRGKNTVCHSCGERGATIGCNDEDCECNFHYSCAEDTGWRFEDDGKEFRCGTHRITGSSACNRISMGYFLDKEGPSRAICSLCGLPERPGFQLVPFQQGVRRAVFHSECLRHTTVVDTTPDTMSRFENSYRNVFSAVERSKVCFQCHQAGATIVCGLPQCAQTFHFDCAKMTGWKPGKVEFRCQVHRMALAPASSHSLPPFGAGPHQHALFSLPPSASVNGGGESTQATSPLNGAIAAKEDDGDCSYYAEERPSSGKRRKHRPREARLTSFFPSDFLSRSILVRLFRESRGAPWNLGFEASMLPVRQSYVLSVSHCTVRDNDNSEVDGLRLGDVVLSINGKRLGTKGLAHPSEVIALLNSDVEFMVEVQRQL